MKAEDDLKLATRLVELADRLGVVRVYDSPHGVAVSDARLFLRSHTFELTERQRGAVRRAIANLEREDTDKMKHTCHWPGCRREVPPRMWGCRQHWFRLPKVLRDLIWATYRPGQEIDKNPSSDYLAVARTVQIWIRRQAGAEASP